MRLLQAHALTILHQHQDFTDLQALFLLLDIVEVANVGVVDLLTDFILVFDLLDHPLVLVHLADDMFESEEFLGPFLLRQVDHTGRTDPDTLKDFISCIDRSYSSA